MLFFPFTGPVTDYVKNRKIIYVPFISATPSGIKKYFHYGLEKKNQKLTPAFQNIIEV